MSLDKNKELVREMVEVLFNQGDVGGGDEFLSPDFIENEELPPGVPTGREGVKLLTGMLHTAFPDFEATIEDLIAEDDKVVIRMTWTGTHEGEFMGIPPTGHRVYLGVFDIVRIADGMIVEHWGLMDNMALMQQIGVMPAPGEGEG